MLGRRRAQIEAAWETSIRTGGTAHVARCGRRGVLRLRSCDDPNTMGKIPDRHMKTQPGARRHTPSRFVERNHIPIDRNAEIHRALCKRTSARVDRPHRQCLRTGRGDHAGPHTAPFATTDEGGRMAKDCEPQHCGRLAAITMHDECRTLRE